MNILNTWPVNQNIRYQTASQDWEIVHKGRDQSTGQRAASAAQTRTHGREKNDINKREQTSVPPQDDTFDKKSRGTEVRSGSGGAPPAGVRGGHPGGVSGQRPAGFAGTELGWRSVWILERALGRGVKIRPFMVVGSRDKAALARRFIYHFYHPSPRKCRRPQLAEL